MDTPISLTNGPIGRGLTRLSFPIFCASILQCLNGTVSAFWIGRFLGESALTALSNVQSMMVLLNAAMFGVTAAATILVGQCMGADDVAGAKRVVGTGVVFFLVLSILLAIFGLSFVEPLLITMRTPPEALPFAISYMEVMLLGLPSMYLFTFVISLLVGIGDSTTPLKFSILAVILGLVLTPSLMFTAERIFGAGVIGAALATVVAQVVCLFVLLWHLYACRHPLRLIRRDAGTFLVDCSIVRELVRKGIPIGAQVFVMSLSAVIMIAMVNRFGVDTTAAYGALMQLWTYILMPALAMAASVSTMSAQNVGAQNWSRVRRTARVGTGYSFIVTGAIVVLVYAADSYAYRLFLPEASAALDIAGHVNRVVTWTLAFMSIPLVLFGVVRAAGAVMVPLLLHVFSLLIVRYPLAAIFVDRYHADAIWWSITISGLLDVLLAIVYYRYGGWQRVERLQLSDRMRVVQPSTRGNLS